MPWTVAHRAPLSLGTLQGRILEWVSMPSSRGIFPAQELNRGLLLCRQILYQLTYQGSPVMVIDPLKLERIEESVRWARGSECKHSFANSCQRRKRGCIQKGRLGQQSFLKCGRCYRMLICKRKWWTRERLMNQETEGRRRWVEGFRMRLETKNQQNLSFIMRGKAGHVGRCTDRLFQFNISSSRGSSWPKDQTHISVVSCISDRFFLCWAIRKILYMLYLVTQLDLVAE